MVYEMSRRPTHRVPVRAAFAGAVALALLVLAGCGVQADHAADAEEGGAEASLPTLPAVEERLPGSYDADGCLLLAEGRDCGARADDVDEALVGNEAGRTLAGFQGPLFTTDVSAGVVTVLEDTVTASVAGPWRAQGLVRNETTSPVLDAEITAVLRDGAGAEIERVVATALVAPVRPGEPAPFVLESELDAAAVASVEWSVVDAGGEPVPGTRDLELTTWFVEPAGEREPLSAEIFGESGEGPFPHVVYGSVTNLADIDAPRPAVVGAWLGEDGRVRAVTASTPAVTVDGGPLDTLAPDALGDFVLRVDGDGGGLDAAPMLLWAVSR